MKTVTINGKKLEANVIEESTAQIGDQLVTRKEYEWVKPERTYMVTVKIPALNFQETMAINALREGLAKTYAIHAVLQSGVKLAGERVEYEVEEVA